eukprot:1157222-Pelagomonas_calceolata.AAC.2
MPLSPFCLALFPSPGGKDRGSGTSGPESGMAVKLSLRLSASGAPLSAKRDMLHRVSSVAHEEACKGAHLVRSKANQFRMYMPYIPAFLLASMHDMADKYRIGQP